jgi:hypothetical protein
MRVVGLGSWEGWGRGGVAEWQSCGTGVVLGGAPCWVAGWRL